MEAFVLATETNWARVYFVFFFFSTVVVAMNVVVALVLEAFITKYSNAGSENEDDSTEELDRDYRDALTTALSEYAEEHDKQSDNPGMAGSGGENDSGGANNGGIGAGGGGGSGGSGGAAEQGKLRRLWQVVLKRRTQRMYKLIFETKNSSDHIRT